jgi:predicted CoA-binding protein
MMPTFKESAEDFLTQNSFAVVGVSRGGAQAANSIYKKLRERDHQVFPINPNADVVEGDACYANLKSVPTKLDGVVIVARPEVANEVVRECVEIGVSRVWMHENALIGPAASSVSAEAVSLAKENGITVIAGGCPMMFLEFGHKCMRWVLGVMGRLPAS